MLVRRVPTYDEHGAAEFLGLAEKTLANKRSNGTGPAYSRMPNGRIRYREDVLERWRDGDTRTSTTESYRPEAVAP